MCWRSRAWTMIGIGKEVGIDGTGSMVMVLGT